MKLLTRKPMIKATLLAPAVALLAGLSTHTMAGTSDYAMVVYEDSRLAKGVMSGDYATIKDTLAALEARGGTDFHSLNNLCVGYTMTKAFTKAEAACDAAVGEDGAPDTLFDMDEAFSGARPRKSEARNREAVALSNRGVLRAVTGDMVGAREDFERAAATSDIVDAAEINLTRLTALAPAPATIAQADR
ncbi:hypothetical protein F3N42_05295 [Marinihelvus fidelis]|uniref:Tetratricopeptide repeat protein n=1 Tax=Marinihelvus fidelis TaxID=2613842 RepID=A0A5N0TC85_9GAMM|nr:hypothetical protein [Marinihelvus fidelis]KAA9132635.1 hypothetical protein F3N42_05295 [Marinihelvus fidelis]